MRVVLDAASDLDKPFAVIPVVIAYEQARGKVAFAVSDANEARLQTKGHPDLVQALVIGFRKAAAMRQPVVVLAIDAAKLCVATSIEFDEANTGVLTAGKAEKLLN